MVLPWIFRCLSGGCGFLACVCAGCIGCFAIDFAGGNFTGCVEAEKTDVEASVKPAKMSAEVVVFITCIIPFVLVSFICC